MLQLQYLPSVESTFFSVNTPMQIFAAPWLRQRASDSTDKAEQPLLSAITLGRCYPVPIESGRLLLPHPDNNAVTILDIGDRRAEWKIRQLRSGIADTNCGMWFENPHESTPQKWAEAWTKNFNNMPQAALGAIRVQLESMINCNEPTHQQQQMMKSAMGRRESVRVVDAWRNVSTFQTFFNAGGVEVVAACEAMGHIMECFKPTRDILDDIRAFKRQYIKDRDEFHAQLGLIFKKNANEVRVSMTERFRDAAIKEESPDGIRYQLVALANRARTGADVRERFVEAEEGEPAGPAPPPSIGSAFPHLRAPTLNALLARLPVASFETVMKVAPQLDALAASRDSPMDKALGVMLERVRDYHAAGDAGKVDFSIQFLLGKIGTAFDKVDEAKVKEVRRRRRQPVITLTL